MLVSQTQLAPTPYLLEVEVLAGDSQEAEAVVASVPSRKIYRNIRNYAIIEDRKRSNACILLKF